MSIVAGGWLARLLPYESNFAKSFFLFGLIDRIIA
jgi:hypothetical protein